MSFPEPSRRLAWALLAFASLLAWGGTLASRAWVRDDRWLILENPLLQARAVKPLLLGGYVQAVMGDAAPIHQWRPVLSLSFLAQVATTGFAQPPLRTVNFLLHVLVAGLLFEALRRRLGARPALAGALLWCVLPVHAEVTAYLTSRSEMLAAASVLGAWLLLGGPARPGPGRLAAGAAVYLLGALSKEHALLFPLFLALADWTFTGLTPWSRERRRVHLALAASAALVLAGRAALLPGVAVGGHPYFDPGTTALSRLLTLSKFWTAHYAVPALTGQGMCIEYGRPLIPDSGAGDAKAWACLLALLGLLGAALRGLAFRRDWAFWMLGPALFLLPTSHLLMELDTIGAQRFLYIPCFFLAWCAGAALEAAGRRRALAAGALLFLGVSYTLRARAQALVWSDEVSLYRAALACNPVSAKTRTALAVVLLERGESEEGLHLLRSALDADPSHYPAAYNLALFSHRRGDATAARRALSEARRLMPEAPDGLLLEGQLAEDAGSWGRAEEAYGRASALRPNDAAARWNHARALAKLGRKAEALAQLDAFLRMAPDDPDAAEGRRWRESLR